MFSILELKSEGPVVLQRDQGHGARSEGAEIQARLWLQYAKKERRFRSLVHLCGL